MLPEADRVRITHMLWEAQQGVAFMEGRSRSDLLDDALLNHAVVRAIEIVGEAAAQVTRETRDALPRIPWSDIIGMRNRVIHAYHAVNLDVVWKTVTEDLPSLIETLTDVLAEAEAPEAEG
jgi:uncharacterized protein with HEPN domain